MIHTSFNAAAFAIALGVFGVAGCQRARVDEQPTLQLLSPSEEQVTRAALVTYADMAFMAYSDAVNGAKLLDESVNVLLSAPTAEGLTAARSTWLDARHPYQQTEIFRFYDGPIDSVELRINTWPIDEGYVEGGGQSGHLGIIDDLMTHPQLTGSLLSALNAKDGETSISTRYHVIEFLLWGTDTRADGPGQRPFTDYVAKTGNVAERRGRYLRLTLELLIRDLEFVRDEWVPERPNYRARFLAMPANEAFGPAVKGLGSLSGPELSGERLTVAYETKAQENEHS